MLKIQNKIIIVTVIVLILTGVIIFIIAKDKNIYENIEEIIEVYSNDEESNSIIYKENSNVIDKIEEDIIMIHISGEVKEEGVIKLKKGSRIIDAINEAGGIKEEADMSRVNLAYVLEDAQKVYIPNINEKEEKIIKEGTDEAIIITGSGGESNKKEEKVFINLNTANLTELQKLSGVGEATAIKIIEYRKANGKFNSIDEIKNIEGIGENKFNKLKDNIYVK